MHHPKRSVRRYQFDPVAHSAHFPLVARHVCAHVTSERQRMREETEWRRDKRNRLLEQIRCMHEDFVTPETMQELQHRIGHINSHLAIKAELKSAIISLKSMLKWAQERQFGVRSRGGFINICDNNTQQLEKEARELEIMRSLRKVAFLTKLDKMAAAALEKHNANMQEMLNKAKILAEEEREEEEEQFIPCDRKLVACGIYKPRDEILEPQE